MREVVDLPDEQLAALDSWRATRGMSRAEAIKQALEATFGLWKARLLDGLAEQERLRAEWDDR
jgi:hypothetical protein